MTDSPESTFCSLDRVSAIYIAEQFLLSNWYPNELHRVITDLLNAGEDDYKRASLLYEFTTLMQEVFLTWSNIMGECCIDIASLDEIE